MRKPNECSEETVGYILLQLSGLVRASTTGTRGAERPSASNLHMA